MKFLFNYLWEISKKVPAKIASFFRRRRKPSIQSSQNAIERHRLPEKKARRKRKSFKSFLRDDSSASGSRSRIAIKNRKMIRNRNHQRDVDRFAAAQFHSQSSSKQNYTHELEPPSPELFSDLNGHQISIIEDDFKRSGEPNIKDPDSDSQLFRFVCGQQQMKETKQNPIKQAGNCNFNFKKSKKHRRKRQWWQKIVDKSQSRSFSSFESCTSRHSIYESDLHLGRASTKSHSNRITTSKPRHTLKVISLIDLIEEDNPKLYHIPMSTKVYN